MTLDRHDLDSLLVQASLDVRRDAAPPEVMEAAAERVWARLQEAVQAPPAAAESGERIRGCDDVQVLLPALVAGTLPPARALLVEDHTRECVPCRRALHAVRAGQPLPVPGVRLAPVLDAASGERRRLPRRLLAVAATLVVATAAVLLLRGPLFAPAGPMGRVEAVEGALLGVEGERATPLAAGVAVDAGRALRTAKGSRSLVRLRDGSTIEMRERAEIALADRSGGTTIQLARGDIIVHAAPQRRGPLYVSTGDCLVSVTGTIFTVSRGTKGSRVGVLEGEVRVARGRRTSVLRPGEQIATHASLAPVPLSREVAWSRDADTYLALLRELADLGRAIEEQVSWPGLRTSTRLLDLTPAGTAVYAALPNVSESLAEAHALLLERVGESAALAAWWRDTMASSGADARLAEVVERLRGFGGHLGDEVVITVPLRSAAGQPPADGDDLDAPLVLAEVARPASFPDVLAAEIARLEQASDGEVHLTIVDDPATAVAASGERLYVWVDGDLFAASPGLELLREVAALRRGAAGTFAGTPFHSRLAEAYGEGAGWLVGVDLAAFADHAAREGADAEERVVLERMGLLDARHLLIERKEQGELTENRAVVSFAGPRQGVASWLAAPAPMGSLDFVSPDASLAAAFVVKAPTALLDDLFALAAAGDPEFTARLAEFERREGIDVRQDLAAPLGGELAFAVDGPMLPVPSWRVVVEVYDPARLQATLERLVARLNAEAASAGEPGVALGSESSSGRTFHVATSAATGLAVHYAYVDGYLVAAPSRALVERAIQGHDTGYSLAGADEFTALLPEDGQNNFSALVYQHLGPALKPLLGLLGGGQGLTPEQQQAMAQLAAEAPATLAYAYGEEDRIVMATRGGGPFGFNLGALMGLRGLGEALRAQSGGGGDS